MRQLFTYWPPRMVSAKWTFQLSRSSTLARAAAMPPSAITVCALPSSDLQTSPTDTPAADASMAALRPAPPAPMTSTSCSCVWYSGIIVFSRGPLAPLFAASLAGTPSPRAARGSSEDPEVRPHAHRAQPDVEIRKTDAEQAGPGPDHVPAIEAADAVVGRRSKRRARQFVGTAAGDVPHGM